MALNIRTSAPHLFKYMLKHLFPSFKLNEASVYLTFISTDLILTQTRKMPSRTPGQYSVHASARLPGIHSNPNIYYLHSQTYTQHINEAGFYSRAASIQGNTMVHTSQHCFITTIATHDHVYMCIPTHGHYLKFCTVASNVIHCDLVGNDHVQFFSSDPRLDQLIPCFSPRLSPHQCFRLSKEVSQKNLQGTGTCV